MNDFASVSYLAPPLVACAIAVALLAFVLRHPRSHANRAFCLVLGGIALWGILTFAMRASPDIESATFWDRLVFPAAIATEVFYYHFSLVLTRSSKQRTLLRLSYLFLIIVVALSPAGFFITSMIRRPFGYGPLSTPAIIPAFFYAFILVSLGIFNLTRGYRTAPTYEERNRLLLITIGMTFPTLGGIMDVFIGLFPASIYGTIVFSLLTAVAMFKYHLFDVRVVLRKSLAYVLTSCVVAIPYTALLFTITGTLKTEAQPWWAQAAVILLLAIFLRPLYAWAQRLVDKAFYRGSYDSLKALIRFSQESHSVEDLDELGARMVDLVRGALRSSTVSLLFRSYTTGGFVTKFSLGMEGNPPEVALSDSSPLVRWMETHRDVVSSVQLNSVPQLRSISSAEKRYLDAMGTELCVPIGAKRGQLAAILIVGRKRSDQLYSLEDKQLLSAVSTQMGMALDNALLYDQARRSEKALRESEDKLRLIFDSTTEGIIVLDLSGKIVQVNNAVLKMHGYLRKEDLEERNGNILVAKKSRAEVTERLKKLMEGDHFRSSELTLLRGDKSEFPGELSGAVMRDASGAAVGIVVVAQDIGGRKEAESKERQLQREVELSQRLASVGQLVSGVAHEINNPLTAILGFTQRLMRKNAEGPNSRDLERIYSEANRVAKVVEDLRTFARRRDPHKELSSVNEILQKALDVAGLESNTHSIEVMREFDQSIPKVMVDFHQMQQVFLNIIMNAQQAMTESKQGNRLVVRSLRTDGFVRVTFTDEGPGIPPEGMARLFEPFYTTRGDAGGTGLGLSICHGIVSHHGGRIHAISAVGEGTTFLVDLPLFADETGEKKAIEEET